MKHKLKRDELSMVLAIIPARTGSVGIPNKNFRPLAERSPVDRALALCHAMRLAVVVSSNKPWCVDHLEPNDQLFYAPDVHTDTSPMVDVVNNVLRRIPGPPNQPILLLQPTQPFRTEQHLLDALNLLKKPFVDSVVSVVPTESPDKLHRIKDGILRPWGARVLPVERRQDALPAYRRNGTVYAFWRRTVEVYRNLYGRTTLPLIIKPEESCWLDTMADWADAERRLGKRD